MPGKRGKTCSYTKEQLIEAVTEVKGNRMTISKAATCFGIPRRTLGDHVNGKVLNFNKPGPKAELSPEIELAVVDYCKYMSNHNFPLRRTDVRTVIVDIIRRQGIEAIANSKFNLDKGPSDIWFKKFEARHTDVNWSVPQTMDKSRAYQSSQYTMDRFFNLYERVLKENDLIDKPHNLFNCDESGINSHVATHEKTYYEKGKGNYQQKVSNIDHITAMMTVCASGKVLPTMIIYEKTMPMMPSNMTLPEKWILATSPNGYIDRELFQTWFLEKILKNCGNERPVLLTLDNHDSHISIGLIDIARQNQIIILAFPAHTTHLLQPLDVGIFGHIKKRYNAIAIAAGSRSCRSKITRNHFPTVWNNAIRQGASPAVIKSAFERSGLYPFDPTAISSTKLIQRQVAETDPVDHITILDPESDPTISTAITRRKVDNSRITPLTPVDLPCASCKRFPYPIGSVRCLPAELESSFPLPDVSSMDAKKPNVRIVRDARIITSDEVRAQLQEKRDKVQQQADAKEERKRKREEKEATKQEKSRKKANTNIGDVQVCTTHSNNELVNVNRGKDSNTEETGVIDMLQAAMKECDIPVHGGDNSRIEQSGALDMLEAAMKECDIPVDWNNNSSTRGTAGIEMMEVAIDTIDQNTLASLLENPIDNSVTTHVPTYIDTDTCYVCKGDDPPVNMFKGKSKGRGKGKGKAMTIDWVGCDGCERWFHCLCVNKKTLKGASSYKCSFC